MRGSLNAPTPPRHVIFDATPEIFATDSGGRFHFALQVGGDSQLEAVAYDEIRFMISIWHPSSQRAIDMDRAYVELSGALDTGEEHWFKLAEIEPVVSPYNSGDTFDGWIVLPVLAARCAFAVSGSGFEPRARLQVRASAYLVA